MSYYYARLAEAKKQYQYQSLPFKLFRQVYPFTEDKFFWSDYPIEITSIRRIENDYSLLWYRASLPQHNGFSLTTFCVVDIPRWKAILFRWYMKRQKKCREAAAAQSSMRKNESTLILDDIQDTIQHQVDANEQLIRSELLNLRRKTAQLTPFEEDYLKTQIRVEV